MYYLFYEYKNVAKKVSPLLIELYPKICPIFWCTVHSKRTHFFSFCLYNLNFIFLLLVLQ